MAASLETWTKHVGILHVSELTLDHLNDWVKTWDYASTTHRSRIDLARQFFRFAIAHKWVAENPAAALIKPAEDLEPTLPFSIEEEEAIFAAASKFGERRHFDGHSCLWCCAPSRR